MLKNIPAGIGEALRDQRAGLEQIVYHRLNRRADMASIEVRSSAFDSAQLIPVKYTADGDGISPPLEWRGIPDSTSSVLVIVEDADSPTPHPLVHGIVVMDPREVGMITGAEGRPGDCIFVEVDALGCFVHFVGPLVDLDGRLARCGGKYARHWRAMGEKVAMKRCSSCRPSASRTVR